jgi:hypothetical protein
VVATPMSSRLSAAPVIPPTSTASSPRPAKVVGWLGDNTRQADVSRVYAGGSFSSIGGTTRNNLAAFDASTGALDPTFNPNLDGQIEGMSLNGGMLYVTGYFSSANVAGRDNLAAFNTSDGLLTSWNPGLPFSFV